jgi:hypothetical protein
MENTYFNPHDYVNDKLKEMEKHGIYVNSMDWSVDRKSKLLSAQNLHNDFSNEKNKLKTNKMENLKAKDLYHGMPVTCEIDGEKITDAKISIDKDGEIYICQNTKDGIEAGNLLGYEHSYCFSYDEDNGYSYVTNLRPAVRKIEDGLVEGDVLIYRTEKTEAEVLGVCGNALFVFINGGSQTWKLNSIIKAGFWKLKQPEVVEEMTMEEGAIDILKKHGCLHMKDDYKALFSELESYYKS